MICNYIYYNLLWKLYIKIILFIKPLLDSCQTVNQLTTSLIIKSLTLTLQCHRSITPIRLLSLSCLTIVLHNDNRKNLLVWQKIFMRSTIHNSFLTPPHKHFLLLLASVCFCEYTIYKQISEKIIAIWIQNFVGKRRRRHTTKQ